MKIGNKLIAALKTKYRSDFVQALATLEVYIANPVGIGEHPQHLEEMDKLVAQMADADDKLAVLAAEYPDA
jgi:hypothetical protein